MKRSGTVKSSDENQKIFDSGGQLASRAETISEACQQQV